MERHSSLTSAFSVSFALRFDYDFGAALAACRSVRAPREFTLVNKSFAERRTKDKSSDTRDSVEQVKCTLSETSSGIFSDVVKRERKLLKSIETVTQRK